MADELPPGVERRECPTCAGRCIVVNGELYQSEPSQLLVVGDDGRWDVVVGYVTHQCELDWVDPDNAFRSSR